MLHLSLEDCREALDAELVDAVDEADAAESDRAPEIAGVGIDTRTLLPGMLYVAIHGERFDGHEFVAEAERAGARAVLVHRPVETRLPQLLVADTRQALGALARHWASRHQVPVVAITGSNGKTTVKEIVAAILGQLGPVLATRGNLNNDIGLPLTLFGLSAEHRYAVVEMGASAAGEIRALAAIAEPTVGVLTNVGPAHLEGFGTLAGVADAKSELFAALDADGFAVINADDDFVDTFRAAAAHCHRREFGRADEADVRLVSVTGADGSGVGDAAGLVVEAGGERLVARFALSGEHNRLNALAAIAAVQCLDVRAEVIVAGLECVQAPPGRLETWTAQIGTTLIDDSYNANPASTRAALAVLAARPGQRHLVLGDMGELGADAETLHAGIGTAARAIGIDGLWTLGPLAKAAQRAWRQAAPARTDDEADSTSAAVAGDGGHFVDVETLLATLLPLLDATDTVLVKGSRSARMERVVAGLGDGLAARAGGAADDGARGGAVDEPRTGGVRRRDGGRSERGCRARRGAGAPESRS